MSFMLLPMGTLHKKREKKRLKIFPAGYVGKFYRNLPDNVDHSFLRSDFDGRIANDSDTPSADVQKYILAISDFAKGIQTGINHYVTKKRINNPSLRQKFDPIIKNIIRRQKPLELVFEDISTFDAENPVVGSLLKKLDVGKKDFASDLTEKALRPAGLDISLRNRLNKLKDGPEPKDDNNNLSPSYAPPQPPPSFSQRPQSGPPPPLPFVPPPSG